MATKWNECEVCEEPLDRDTLTCANPDCRRYYGDNPCQSCTGEFCEDMNCDLYDLCEECDWEGWKKENSKS